MSTSTAQPNTTAERSAHVGAARRPTAASTRGLLAAGLVAGPVYVTTSLTQALTRDGFDLTRHAWSQLANGDLRWIQITNLAVTGLLVITFAVGMGRALAAGRGSRWAPRLVAVFGAGMFAAAFFAADPALGFPPGTPEDYREMSAGGVGHMLCASIGFLGVIIACVILARRYAAAGEQRWAITSAGVGVLYTGSLVGLSATGSGFWIVTFTLGVVAVFSWLFALAVRYRRETASR